MRYGLNLYLRVIDRILNIETFNHINPYSEIK